MTVVVLMGLLLQLGTGVVEGVVTSDAGKPQAGVRVAALPDSDNIDVLMSIDRTDENGHYRLEIPAGRYNIVAGRIECPTYYPGTKERPRAASVAVASGTVNSGLDFRASTESMYKWSVLLGNALPCDQGDWPGILRAFLAGSTHSAAGTKFLFALAGVRGRTVSFKTDVAQLSNDCSDCSFLVQDTGMGPPSADSGILFRLSANGQDLDLTCQAKGCQVISVRSSGVPVLLRLKQNEKGTVQTSDQVAFAIIR